MEDILLYAFGGVARRNQWANGSYNNVTFFNSSRLGVFDAVRFHSVDNGPPLAFDVDGSKRTDVIGGAQAKVKFVVQFIESVDRIVCICQLIFIECLERFDSVRQEQIGYRSVVISSLQETKTLSVFCGMRNLVV